MKIDSKFRLIVMAVMVLMSIWFIWSFSRDWITPRLVKALGGYTQMEMKTTKDTLEVKYNDIYVKYKKFEAKALTISEPEYITEYRYIPIPNSNTSSTTGKVQPQYVKKSLVKRYLTSINDSILVGNIETVLSLDSCKIVSQSLKYEPKIPYIREKIITIVETKETILSQKPKAHIGIGLDVNSLNQLTPQLLYLTKKKWLYKGGYIKTLDKQYPDAYMIGIAKLF